MNPQDLKQRIAELNLIARNYTVGSQIAAKDVATVVEQILRFVFHQTFPQLLTDEQQKIEREIAKIDKQKDEKRRGVDNFTLGELNQVFDNAKFFEMYERALQQRVEVMKLISFPEFRKLRNQLAHQDKSLSYLEVKFLISCLELFVDTFLPPEQCVIKQRQYWNVSRAYDPLFIGRETVLQHLEDGLQTHQIVALAGFPGMGKTHTAVQFAYLHRHEYQAVLWLSAANVGLITSEFAKLVTVLQLPVAPDAKDDEKFHAVQHWLETHSQWLLVIDNADEWRETWQSVKWLTALKGKVLFTSRADAVKPAEQVELAVMTASEAVACLLQRALTQQDREAVTAEERTQLQQFCMEELDGLPLALNQAGAYIEQTRCGLRGYMQRFQQHAMKLLAKPGDAHDPVATTFDLSLEQVAKRNAAAVELLRICAFLDSDQIAEEIFLQGAEQLGEPLQVLQQDELELDEMLEALLRYSLIKREATGLSMHRLLQRVVRHQLPQPKEYATRAMNAVDAVFPYIEFENWSACERLLPSAAACCHHILKYAIATETAGLLLNQTAYYLQHSKANYAQALPLFQEALKIREQVLGKQHPEYASSLNNLAQLYYSQGQYEQTLPLYQKALKIVEQVLGQQHPDYAGSLNNLAMSYKEQGKYEQAFPLLKEASEIWGHILGKQHPDYAKSIGNLVALYYSQGEYDKALPLFQEVVNIFEQVFGKQHPDTAQSIWWLATYYEKMRDYEQALPLFQEALDIYINTLGEQHPCTKTVRGNYEACLKRKSLNQN